MNKIKKQFVYSLFFLFVAQFVIAQKSLPLHPIVKEGINKAIIKNKTLKNRELEINKSAIQRKELKNKYIPKVEFKGMYAYTDGEFTIDLPTTTVPLPNILLSGISPTELKNLEGVNTLFKDDLTINTSSQLFHTSLMAKSVIFSGLRIPNAAKAIEKKIEGEQFLLAAEKDKIAKEVIDSFDKLTLLKKAEEIIASSKNRLSKEQLRVQKAIENGLAIPYDNEKIELAILELNAKTTEINGNKGLLKDKIKYLTGLDKAEAVSDTLQPFYLLKENSFSVKMRNEIKALKAFKEAKGYMLKKEKGAYLPTVGAFLGLTYSGLLKTKADTQIPMNEKLVNLGKILGSKELPIKGPKELVSELKKLQALGSKGVQSLGQARKVDFNVDKTILGPNFIAGIALKWELFGGFERKHQVEKAKIEIEQIDNKLTDTKEKIELQLKNNLNSYETSNNLVKIAQQQETIASNNLKITQKQYRLGLTSISERLSAENDLLKAQLNSLKIISQQRIAAVNVLIASGELAAYLK